jgi:hypothetical protein
MAHSPRPALRPGKVKEIDMNALELALFHISHGIGYSWDLSTLISSGVSVSRQLRQKLLAGATTNQDADQIRILLGTQARARRLIPRKVFN